MGNKFFAPFFHHRSPPFWQFCRQISRKRPSFAARRKNFENSPRTIVVLRWVLGMYRQNYAFGQKPRCPAIIGEKSAVFAQFGPFFTKNCGALRFLPKNVVLPIHPLDPTQNYNRTWGILKIPPLGRDLGPFPRTFKRKSAKISKIMVFQL